MSATMVASEVKAVPPVVSSIQDIPLAQIRESTTNPRRFFDEAKLAELAFVITSITVALFFSAAALCQLSTNKRIEADSKETGLGKFNCNQDFHGERMVPSHEIRTKGLPVSWVIH